MADNIIARWNDPFNDVDGVVLYLKDGSPSIAEEGLEFIVHNVNRKTNSKYQGSYYPVRYTVGTTKEEAYEMAWNEFQRRVIMYSGL